MKVLLLALLSVSLFAQASNTKQTRKLWDAIEDIDVTKAQTAIERGADVNSINPDGRTAITNMISRCINTSVAISDINKKSDLLEICELIINSDNFDINQQRPFTRRTPLQVASAAGSLQIVKALEGIGSRVNFNGSSKSPIQLAARNGTPDVVSFLLTIERVDINDGDRRCALAMAVKYDHLKLVNIILDSEKAKNLNRSCIKGALSNAKYSGQLKMIDALEKLKPLL